MYTTRMMRRAISISALAAALLLAAGIALAQDEARVKPFDWPGESTFEFGIFDTQGARIATAYYRILKEQLEGQTAYRLKYVGRNEQTSEASECWIHPDTMLPMRSTRKLVSGGRTFYLDVAYGEDMIVLRRKYEGEEPTQQQMPAVDNLYDYESLIWLIPQLDFGTGTQARLNVFDTLNYAATTVMINDLGEENLEIRGVTYPTHAYSFEVSLTPYKYWTVVQDGRAVPARFDPGSNSFINLGLDLKKCTTKAPPANAKPPAAKPKPVKKNEQKEEQEETAPPGENPLGPPPPGHRF